MTKRSKKKGSKVAKRSAKKVSKVPEHDKEAPKAEDKGGMTVDTLEKQKEHQSARVKPGERLYLNAAKDTLVPEGHKDAATLYCTEHKEVPRAEYESLKRVR